MISYPTFEQGLHYDDLYADYQVWQKELEFFKSEIRFFHHLLENYAGKHNGFDDRARVEQFQNKFILQDEQTDLLMHDVREQEKRLGNFIKEHEKNIEFITFKDHITWRDRMDTHRRLYQEMKQEFYNALTPNKN